METAREVKVAPGSPESGKGGDYCALLGKQGRNGGALSPWSRWEPEDRGRKKEKGQTYEGGTLALEIDSFDWGALER